MGVLEYFDRGYVINLPRRRDRRAETEAMFDRRGLTNWRDRVEFFPAIAPESAAGYASIGARGGLLSHAAVLRAALDRGARNVLVMEDDLEIDPAFVARGDEIVGLLESLDWSFVYFGHNLRSLWTATEGPLLRPRVGHVILAHLYAVNGRILPRLVEFMESVDSRPVGDPDGGPMYADGALDFFRVRNPDALTLVAAPCLGWQRPSASDITSKWYDKAPVLGGMAAAARKLKRAVRGRRVPE